MHDLGDILRDKGDLAGAGKAYEEALALRTALGGSVTIAKSEMALARLAVEEGRPETAEPRLRSVADVFAAGKAADDEASAQGALAAALLSLGRSAEASSAAERAAGLSARTQSPHVRLAVGLDVARVRAADGQLEAAFGELSRLSAEAGRLHLMGLQLEVRLTEGELAVRAGRADARDRLAALARDARAHGFGHVAGRAESLSGTTPPRGGGA